MFMGNYCFFHTGNYYDYEQVLFFSWGQLLCLWATTFFYIGNYYDYEQLLFFL